MREEIDALRAQLRDETARHTALRVEADEARTTLADHTRRTEEKERSVVRLRAALTTMEVLHPPPPLHRFSSILLSYSFFFSPYLLFSFLLTLLIFSSSFQPILFLSFYGY